MPVQEDADQTYKLFGVGDKVKTSDGPGTVTGVQFNTAKYNDRWELEPPQIEVELDDGKTIHTCLCELELPHTKKGTKLIHQEFDRLWPPITDEVPEDADSMIPEGEEDQAMLKKGATPNSDYVIGPNDPVIVVIVPKPGSTLYPVIEDLDPDRVFSELVYETTFEQAQDFFRGVTPRDYGREDYYLVSDKEAAYDILGPHVRF